MDQKIPYASVRFSVISTRNAKLFWEQTERQPHFVSGTADAIINFSAASVKELVRYIAFLSTKELPVDENHSVSMQDPFG